MLKKFPWDKTNVNITNALFFLLRAPTHNSFTFNLRFSYEMKHQACLSKTVCGIFNLRFRFVFIKVYIFASTKCMNSLTLRRHNSFQNYNNRIATHSFAARPVIFNLQQEVLKLSYICVSWSSAKTDLVTIFFKLEIEVLRTLNFLNSNF